MFYIAKITYYSMNLETILLDEEGNLMEDIPNPDQLDHLTVQILVSANNNYTAKKIIESVYGATLEKIFYIKPTGLKIVNINNINSIAEQIEKDQEEIIDGEIY